MTLAELQRIKQWHVAHRTTCPLQYHVWDAMLMLWMMGWVGWIPSFAFGALWCMPLCMLGMSAPDLYVAWRRKAHRQHRVRCDWAPQLARQPARRR